MDIPHRGTRPMALPQIHVHDSITSDRYRGSHRPSFTSSLSSPSTVSVPMPIPNMRDPVPPPLPPPKHLADIAAGGNNGPDIAWQWGNSRHDSDWGGSSVTPGSSLYGSYTSRKSLHDDRESARRSSSSSTIKSPSGHGSRENSYPRIDEGYSSLSGTSIDSYSSKHSNQSSVKSGFQSSVHDQYRSTAQAYDKSLLQKLDARRGSESITPPRKFANSAFGSASDASPTSRIALDHRHPVQLKALSLPIITSRLGLAESPLARWTETPTAISPGDPYPRPVTQVHDLRSPSDSADYDRRRRLINGSSNGPIASVGDDASGPSRDSYDQRISPDQDADFQMEETGFRRLHIGEYSGRPDPYSPGVTAGQKRRASSPPGDEGPPLHSAGSAGDLYRRREAAAMSSPSSRYQSLPGSISSTASGPRSNSYASTPSLGGSSITSMNSYGRLSPGGASPVPTDGSDSPYVTSLSLNPSPRGSMSRTNHGRALSDTRPLMTSRKLSDTALHSKQSTGPKLQGVFICECCPKKPKKFDSQEELNAHEQEKQYECAYCRNRFKNKNEAERHQNSLHLRRHSWSCAALSGYAAAFHSSPTRPNEADACGYCGEEFLRSGVSSPSQGRHQVAVVTEQDWEIRVVHLQEMHKFRECNHAKKFFRADHFRQHLKHSHAGTSGKWTNMLENACMKDEPLPEPIRGRERVGPGNARVARINEEEEIL